MVCVPAARQEFEPRLFWVKDSFPLEKGKKKTSNDLTSVDFFFLFPQTFCSEFQDREFITNAFCSDLGVEKMSGKSEIWGYCKYWCPSQAPSYFKWPVWSRWEIWGCQAKQMGQNQQCPFQIPSTVWLSLLGFWGMKLVSAILWLSDTTSSISLLAVFLLSHCFR